MSNFTHKIILRGQDKTKGAFKSAQGNASKLKGALAALGAGAAVAGILRIGKNAIDLADRMQKLSLQVGVSTEFLSQMKFVAEQNGASFESLTTGVQKMQRSIEDANDGLSTQVRAFDKLGLSVSEIKKLSPEEQFSVIADRVGKLKDPTEKVAISMQLFGRAGRELIPIFNQGSEGIDRMRESADGFGVTLKQSAADNAADFKDRMNELQNELQGATRTIVTELLPGINDFIKSIVQAAKNGGGFKDAMRGIIDVFKVLGKLIGFVKDLFDIFGKTLGNVAGFIVQAFQKPLVGMRQALSRTFSAVALLSKGEFRKAAAEFSAGAKAMGKGFSDGVKVGFKQVPNLVSSLKDDVGKELDQITNDFGDTGKASKEMSDTIGDAADKIQRTLPPALDDVSNTSEQAAAAQKKVTDAAQGIIDKLEPAARATRNFQDEAAKLTAALGSDLVPTEERLGELLSELKTKYDDQINGLSAVGDSAKTMAETMDGAFSDIADNSQNAFSSMIDNFDELAKKGELTGKKILKSLGQSFRDSAAQAGAALGGAIGGPAGAALGGIIGDKIAGIISGVISRVFGGIFGKKPRLSISTGVDTVGAESQASSPFGTIFANSKKFGDAERQKAVNAIADLDKAFASLLSGGEIDKVATALRGFEDEIKGKNLSIDDLLKRRTQKIADVLDPLFGSIVSGFTDAKDKATALVATLGIFNSLEFDFAGALADIKNPATDAISALQKQKDALIENAQAFDGSLQSLKDMSAGAQQFQQAALAVLRSIQTARDSVSGTIGGAIESITLGKLDQRGQFEFLSQKLSGLLGSIGTLKDPQAVTDTTNQIAALVQQLVGLSDGLDPLTQSALNFQNFGTAAPDFGSLAIGLLQNAEQAAQDRLDQLEADTLTLAESVGSSVRDAFAEFVPDVVDAGRDFRDGGGGVLDGGRLILQAANSFAAGTNVTVSFSDFADVTP